MSYYQFSNEFGERYGSCEIFKMDRFDLQDAGILKMDASSPTGWVSFGFGMGGTVAEPAHPSDWEGWYWQACFPGCLPDGDPMGPFPSESEAMIDADVATD